MHASDGLLLFFAPLLFRGCFNLFNGSSILGMATFLQLRRSRQQQLEGEEMLVNWLKKGNSQGFYCGVGMARGYATVRRAEVIE